MFLVRSSNAAQITFMSWFANGTRRAATSTIPAAPEAWGFEPSAPRACGSESNTTALPETSKTRVLHGPKGLVSRLSHGVRKEMGPPKTKGWYCVHGYAKPVSIVFCTFQLKFLVFSLDGQLCLSRSFSLALWVSIFRAEAASWPWVF